MRYNKLTQKCVVRGTWYETKHSVKGVLGIVGRCTRNGGLDSGHPCDYHPNSNYL